MISPIAYGAAAALWLGLVLFFHHYRVWLFYYTIAAVGLAFLLILGGTRLIPLERWLEIGTAHCIHAICELLGIPTRVFEAAPGNILVWVVVQEPGWTVVRIDLECSGLLEMSVLSGLILFYPLRSVGKRVGLTLLGWAATAGANVVRILTIILILHLFGKRSILIAHTVVGRIVFFALTAALYWFTLSKPTIRILAGSLQERMKA